jgi:divalent metal cation (Fe/Co/Zn/Cd) transporter
VHAPHDGFTSPAVVLGAIGGIVGLPLADPIGVVTSVAIIVRLWGTVRSIGRRLMDDIEPELVDRLLKAEHKAGHALPDLDDLSPRVRLPWDAEGPASTHRDGPCRPEAAL